MELGNEIVQSTEMIATAPGVVGGVAVSIKVETKKKQKKSE
jgi:hypothetical protein